MSIENNKIMSTREAVAKFVEDGDMLVNANFLHGNPYALVHEIIRQKKKNLTVVSCSNIEETDLLLAGGCVNKIIISYYHRAGGKTYKRELDRALREKTVEFEDYTNFTMCAMLKAGAEGKTFAQVLSSVKHSDVYNIRTIMGENKFWLFKKFLLSTIVNDETYHYLPCKHALSYNEVKELTDLLLKLTKKQKQELRQTLLCHVEFKSDMFTGGFEYGLYVLDGQEVVQVNDYEAWKKENEE